MISHYRLLERLGEGGMGVVYRAEDLRLGRDVAIKLLRQEAIGSAEWLARFEREARLASSLQHPHICTIHELGEHDGQPFIVMERLEGVTIGRVVESGPMPPQKVLEFARQIADALDAAHRRGIIHRDIKPANLFITYGDHLKVLDFGLAKTTVPKEPATGLRVGASAAHAVTGTGVDVTRTGIALGTASYMSPEQALGRPLDARTDLFSFGSVLYEMATGHRAFGGDSVPLVIMRIINGIVVPARTENAAIPEALDAIIRKLMTGDPERRYQTAADLLADIDTALRDVGRQTGRASDAGAAASALGSRRTIRRLAASGGIGAVVVAGIALLRWSVPVSGALTERDRIVIGTIQNNTGDQIFDDALVTAVKVQLGQSPFLDIVADQRIGETLRMMGRPADERLTHNVARDACQRLGVKAMLDGTIAALGRNYVLTLSATDCRTGEPIAREQGEAAGKERVLNELGAIARRMRVRLGESLPAIQRFDAPIEQATTPSLAALRAYALGLEERRRGRELESVPFFNEAVERDRDFASAYAMLSTVYGSLGELPRSEEYARLAYKLRNRVSERERLFITHQYYDRVAGDQDRAVATLELWKSAYPRDPRPANALAMIHNRLGRYERAEAEAREALRRSPGHPFPLSNLAFAYRSMGRYAEARKVAEEAVTLGVATSPTRRLLYQLGTLARDGSASAQVAWSRDRPREFDIVSGQAQVAAFQGRVRAAGELYRRASDIALGRRLRGTASGFIAHLAWTEALYGNQVDVAQRVGRTLTLVEADAPTSASVPRFRLGAALGLAGLFADAEAVIRRAEQQYPDATFVRTVLSPCTRAAIALRRNRPDAAIQALEDAAPTELGTVAGLVPGYLRAEALRLSMRLTDALHQYEEVLRHRGVDPFAPVIPMAHLGMARARAQAGDRAGSRQAYENLFAIWKDADVDFYPLVAARAEYRRLMTPPTAAADAGRP